MLPELCGTRFNGLGRGMLEYARNVGRARTTVLNASSAAEVVAQVINPLRRAPRCAAPEKEWRSPQRLAPLD